MVHIVYVNFFFFTLGKQKVKVSKDGSGQEKNTTQATKSQKLKQQDVGLRQGFNGVSITPGI